MQESWPIAGLAIAGLTPEPRSHYNVADRSRLRAAALSGDPVAVASDTTDFSNQFLLAMPNMADPNFSGAVVLIAEHSDRGALGLVVNKPTTMTIGSLLERIDLVAADGAAIEQLVFHGGPVQTDRGFVLHEQGPTYNSSTAIGSTLMLTTSRDVLEAVADGRGPGRILVTLGYAGWGPGQLEAEIAQNAWLTTEVDTALLFDTPADDRFLAAWRRLGIDPALLAPAAGHA